MICAHVLARSNRGGLREAGRADRRGVSIGLSTTRGLPVRPPQWEERRHRAGAEVCEARHARAVRSRSGRAVVLLIWSADRKRAGLQTRSFTTSLAATGHPRVNPKKGPKSRVAENPVKYSPEQLD